MGLSPLKLRKQITEQALVKELALPDVWIYTAALAPDGRTLVLGISGGIVVVDLEDGTHQRFTVEAAQQDVVSKLRFTSDGTRVIATCWKGCVLVLAWPSLRTIASYSITPKRLHACAVLPDDASAWVGGHDCVRTRIDLATGDILATQTGEWGWISDLALTPDGSTLITADAATTVRLCDGTTGRMRSELKLGIAQNIIVGETEALVPSLNTAIVDLATGTATARFDGEHKLGPAAAVYADEMIISSGGQDPLLVVWERATQRPLLTMKPIKKLAFAAMFTTGEHLVCIPVCEFPLQIWRTSALLDAARAQR